MQSAAAAGLHLSLSLSLSDISWHPSLVCRRRLQTRENCCCCCDCKRRQLFPSLFLLSSLILLPFLPASVWVCVSACFRRAPCIQLCWHRLKKARLSPLTSRSSERACVCGRSRAYGHATAAVLLLLLPSQADRQTQAIAITR